jgi:hypothetical protein
MPQTIDTAVTQIRELGKAIGEGQISRRDFVKAISDGEGKIDFELFDEITQLQVFLDYVRSHAVVR